MPPSTLPSPITTMKLRFSTGTSPNVLTYEQTIPSAAQGANSVQVTNSSLLAAFSSEPLGTIFTPSMVTTYSGFPSGDTLSTPSVVPNFIPRVISLADIPNKQLSVDAPFSLSSFISTLSTGVLSYTSSNASVATVHASTGLVTLVGEGTTTITVNQAADATYIAASASTTLTVTPPPLISLAANGVTIQYTGSAVDVPSSSPRFIQENPRGTGAEWFAVVKDTSKSQITSYATSGTSSYFTQEGESTPVPFNNIVTTLMTDMSAMFYGASAFNQNIGSWNTSNVITIDAMFGGASAFNKNIGEWNVSNVTSMVFMFGGASAFNQNIGSWNTSNVTSMNYMFYYATLFDQDISEWNVSQVIDFASFRGNSALTTANTPPAFR